MTILDKIVAAVTPPESDEARAEAREKARVYASSIPWLAAVLEHHLQIEAAFEAIRGATDSAMRRSQQLKLMKVLTAHSVAEEGVLYPAMALSSQKAHAMEAYTEQSAAKIQLVALDELDPMSADYLDKLGHLQGAVQHHMYREESSWFPQLIEDQPEQMHVKLAARYQEEFSQYLGLGSLVVPMGTNPQPV